MSLHDIPPSGGGRGQRSGTAAVLLPTTLSSIVTVPYQYGSDLDASWTGGTG